MINDHETVVAVISVVFQRPPFIPPMITVLPVASDLSTKMALTLPEAKSPLARVLPFEAPGKSLIGPLSFQASPPILLDKEASLESMVC